MCFRLYLYSTVLINLSTNDHKLLLFPYQAFMFIYSIIKILVITTGKSQFPFPLTRKDYIYLSVSRFLPFWHLHPTLKCWIHSIIFHLLYPPANFIQVTGLKILIFLSLNTITLREREVMNISKRGLQVISKRQHVVISRVWSLESNSQALTLPPTVYIIIAQFPCLYKGQVLLPLNVKLIFQLKGILLSYTTNF